MRNACGDCHDGADGEGGFSLDDLSAPESLLVSSRAWFGARQRMLDHTMPPADAEPIRADLRASITASIQKQVRDAVVKAGVLPGPPQLRRLTRNEFANSIRDLLNVHLDAAANLPEDNAGGEGFTNASETLSISPIHAEKYVDAITNALQYASRDANARKQLFSVRPSDDMPERQAARQNLSRLALAAFRGPLAESELDGLMSLYDAASDDDDSHQAAMLYAMRSILLSPRFLFIAESVSDQAEAPEPLTPHELATRLSYFLWTTTPDELLMKSANSGKLTTPDELRRQTIRLLEDRGTHLRDSMTDFIGQWLGLADLGRAKQVDQQRHDWIEEPHLAGMRNQPVYDFETLLRKNRPLTELIDSDHTHLNRFLLEIYKIPRKQIESKIDGQLRWSKLPEDQRHRGGWLGSAGVLAISSYPSRSSPVLRGAWVLEKLMGIELPPPPPDVPALEESASDDQPASLRDQLAQHRQDASCASCHDRLD
ncbi:MAG: DUF1592 domain-containing protein, partial [Planctomycetota bacterium]